MKKSAFFIIVLSFLALVPYNQTFGEDASQFSLDFGGWYASINPQAKSGNGASNIDVTDDLGLDERKTIFPVSVNLNLGGPYNLFADFYSFSVSGNKVIDQAITYNQNTFVASTLTSGKYKQDEFKAGLRYKMTSRTDNDFYVRGGVMYQKLKLDISNSLISSSDSLDVPFPFIGIEIDRSYWSISKSVMILHGILSKNKPL